MSDATMPRRTRSTGHCLCEGVSYRVDGPLRDVLMCHCDRCRRTTGHFMAATSAAIEDVAFDQDATLQWYRSDTVEYGFCNRCGASLFWRADDKLDRLAIAAGTLDPPTGLSATQALFVDDASDYHRLDHELEEFPHDWP